MRCAASQRNAVASPYGTFMTVGRNELGLCLAVKQYKLISNIITPSKFSKLKYK